MHLEVIEYEGVVWIYLAQERKRPVTALANMARDFLS
jgi:hypothetical protein